MRTMLVLCYFVAVSLAADSSSEGEGGAGGSFRDYLPMNYLSKSPTAQQDGGATKSQFYDFLPAQLQGRRPKKLEIRSVYSVSY